MPLALWPKRLELLSWNPDTEEARVAFLYEPGGTPGGAGGWVGLFVLRDESLARELVRRYNAAGPC